VVEKSTTGLRRWAHALDELVPIPGTKIRFGLDSIIGLIPGAGDATGAVLSAYTLLVGVRVGAPPSVLLRIGGNILVDAIVGVVPVLGDLFDVGFKANKRNVALLDRYMDRPEEVHSSSRVLVVGLLAALLVVLVGAAMISLYLMRWLFSQF